MIKNTLIERKVRVVEVPEHRFFPAHYFVFDGETHQIIGDGATKAEALHDAKITLLGGDYFPDVLYPG